MGGDLEDGVRRGVDDPFARAPMLLAELLDDLRAGSGLVPEYPAASAVGEFLDDLGGEAVRIRGHGLGRDDPHQLPVAGRRVFSLRPLDEPARESVSLGLRRAALELLDVT